MMTSKRLLAVAISAALYAPLSAFATNGMDMEGYGPIATGMGGASMAYDNGTAAMANNAATLGLAPDGNRFDLAVGVLQPNIHSDAYAQDSKATQFIMPAIGWVNKSGKLAYGAGVFAQGGMGAEYNVMLPDGSSGKDRSELGVGRFMIPVAYNVNDALTVGGSIDYVWATLDLQMTAPGSMLAGLVTGGSLAGALPSLNPAAGRFDFSDSSDYTGAAKGQGFAGKLGMTYKVSPAITVGVNYQSKTSLGDLETSGNGATLSLYGGSVPGGAMSLNGKITVKDFQWPETFGVGMAWHANDALMVAADVKQIQWSGVMKNFKMSFSSAAGTLDVSLPQNWKDQTVFQLGAAYKFTQAFTGRIGANISSNPIPDSYVNPLFPATIEDHYTLGAGYAFNDMQEINASFVYAPEVKVTSPTVGQITHSQMNWQLMYSHRF